MKRALFSFFLLVSSFMFLPSANAVLVEPVGDPTITGSWTSGWNIGGASFNKVEIFIVGGDTDLESPGMDSFSVAGWSASLINPDYSLATGPSTGFLTVYALYTADLTVPFKMDIVIYTDAGNIGICNWGWTGSQWVGESGGNQDPGAYNRSSVPEPSALLLLGSGLIGLVGYGKRKIKK